MKYSKSAYIAISGITAALSAVIMIGSLFPSLSYAIPMAAGGVLIIPISEFGEKKTLPVYFSVFFISMILPVVAKDAALLYLFLFGLYPLLQFSFERIRIRPIRIMVKLVYFNLSALAAVWVAGLLFSIPFFESDFAWWMIAGLLVIANLVFLFYDLALYKFSYLYDVKYSEKFRRLFKIK